MVLCTIHSTLSGRGYTLFDKLEFDGFAQLTVDSGKWTVVVSPSGMDLNNNPQKYHVFFYSETFFGLFVLNCPEGIP